MTTTEPVSAARLAVSALGLKPVGSPWQGDAPVLCSMEGMPILPGEPAVASRQGANFMDDFSMVTRSGRKTGVISGYVAALMPRSVMIKCGTAVITADAAYSIATDDARAWFYLTPPEPPFVACIGTAVSQHLVWRTPPSLSRDLVVFRNGASLMTFRPAMLQRVLDAMDAHEGRVFSFLDRNGADLSHGRVQPGLAEDDPALYSLLSGLSPGELFAMATLSKKNRPTPTQPEPIIL